MKTKLFLTLFLCFGITILFAQNSISGELNGAKQVSKQQQTETVKPESNPVYSSPMDIGEGFDDITLLPGSGWAMINMSNPLGVTNWFQGNNIVFPAYDGAATAYIAANFNNTTGGTGTISNWLITPMQVVQDGDEISFYTRVPTGSIWADRLQVRLSTNGSSTDVGGSEFSVGDFTHLLLDINSSYSLGVYPEVWTQYTAVVTGVGGPVSGRFALRYFVENAGPSGVNSNYIGIDRVEFARNLTVPLSNWAIIIGVILILSFAIIRYRRMN